MNYELSPLSASDGKDVYDMLQTLPADENGFINNAFGMTEAEFSAWLTGCEASARQEGIVDGWKVPQSTYWLYVDGRPVGIGKIRHFLTDKLRETGGTLGYAIAPAERGKGYGKALLRAMLGECRAFGIDRVLVTIREDNASSLRVALANGGKLEKTVNGRHYVWIDVE